MIARDTLGHRSTVVAPGEDVAPPPAASVAGGDRVLLAELSAFARTLAGQQATGEVVADLVRRLSAVLRVAGAGASLARDGGLCVVAALDDRTREVERSQEEHQAGSCVEAFRSREPVRVADLEGGVRPGWEDFAARAHSAGFRAVAALPLCLEDHRLGAVDLYDAEAREWSDGDIEAAQVLVDMATSYLVASWELARQRQTTAQLETALKTRIVIEQAKGMIAAERRMSVDQAFEVLRSHARSHNADLRSTAEAVVRLGLRP